MARYGRPYWQFHRADLLDLLAQGAREAGVEIVTGTEVAAVTPEADGVRLDLGAGRSTRAGILIAADGVRSGVRAAQFGGSAPRFTGHVAWRGLVPAETLPPGIVPDAACVTMGPGRHLVTYPLRNGRLINFVAVEAREAWQDEGWMQPDEAAHLRAAFAGWTGLPEAVLGGVEETFLWGLFDHPILPDWTRGRIALLGDACHAMLPFLAQGAAMALEDAWVLAAELDVAAEPERGLMAYEARRKPRVTRVQRASARNARIYHLDGPARGVAQSVLRLGSALAPGALLGRFDWLYGADVVSAQATG
jgi:salicylate hydroxylase